MSKIYEIYKMGHVCNMTVRSGQMFFLRDDIFVIFGHKRTPSGKIQNCTKEIHNHGVYFNFNSQQACFWSHVDIRKFVEKSSVRPEIKNKALSVLQVMIREYSKVVEQENAAKSEQVTEVKEEKNNGRFVSDGKKFKIVGIEWSSRSTFIRNIYKLTFSNGVTKEVSAIYKKSADVVSECAISGKQISHGDEIFKFEIKKKGYGAYSILRSEIE